MDKSFGIALTSQNFYGVILVIFDHFYVYITQWNAPALRIGATAQRSNGVLELRCSRATAQRSDGADSTIGKGVVTLSG